jgi:uncharacterized protein (DUF58 family)
VEQREYALLQKIKFATSRKIDTLFVGEYHSAFKGYGLSFDSVREYQYGDDVRNIDWNVSARMRHLFIKEFIEERELSVVLMVDISGSTDFGAARTKRDLILEVASIFLYLSQMNHDRLSVILFTDKIEKYMRPKKGRKYILKVLGEILKCSPQSRSTDIGMAIDFASRVLKKRSIVFLISDFLDCSEDYRLKMKIMSRRHDLIPVRVHDPLELEMRIFGFAQFVDLETGRSFYSDTIPEKNELSTIEGFNSIELSTGESIEIPILKFFEKRNRTKLTK